MSEKIPEENKPPGRIEKLGILDDDMVGWIELFRAENFSEKEIDGILSKLNRTYRDKVNPNWIEERLEDIGKCLERDYGRKLTDEQKEKFRKFAKEKL